MRVQEIDEVVSAKLINRMREIAGMSSAELAREVDALTIIERETLVDFWRRFKPVKLHSNVLLQVLLAITGMLLIAGVWKKQPTMIMVCVVAVVAELALDRISGLRNQWTVKRLSVTSEMLEALESSMDLISFERQYLEILVKLCDSDLLNKSQDGTALLQRLNTLLSHARTLSSYAVNIRTAVSNSQAGEFESKLEDLTRRSDHVRDNRSKAAADHGAQILRERIEKTKRLELAGLQIAETQARLSAAFIRLDRMLGTEGRDLSSEVFFDILDRSVNEAQICEQNMRELASIRA